MPEFHRDLYSQQLYFCYTSMICLYPVPLGTRMTALSERYMSSPRASLPEIHNEREAMIERLNKNLRFVADWGDSNLVKFNPEKTQACLFSTKRSPFDLTPTVQGVSLQVMDNLELLEIQLTSDLNFGRSIEQKARTAARKLGILFKVKRYFTPEQLLSLYQAHVRSCVEYCCHLWDGSAKYQLAALDSIERRARRLVGDEALWETRMLNLQHRRQVACLSVFYKLHFGECAQELHDLIPPSPFHQRTTRRREGFHPYVVDIPEIRTKRFASTFIIRTAKVWNSLPASVFPSSYNLGVFKSRVNRHLAGKRDPSSASSSLTIR